MLIIGIAGGTGCGKSTLVRKIMENIPSEWITLVPQDSYYKDSSHVPDHLKQSINFDHPDAFDWELLTRQIAELRAGKSIEQPVYSYLTCSRLAETVHVEPRKVIIIEGILAFTDETLRNLMDVKVFVDADSDERLIRLIDRDCRERNRTAEEVTSRYLRVLKPMHQQFIEPCKQYADLIIPRGGENILAMEMLIAYIKNCL